MHHIYHKAYEACLASVASIPGSADGGPANPVVLKAPETYWDSKLKVLFFGQETNGQEGSYREAHGLKHLYEVYDRFVNKGGNSGYAKAFWNYINKLSQGFYEIDESYSMLANNIIKIGKDWSKGRPPLSVLEWQQPWTDLIKDEVSYFSPDVVVFLTGPLYDDRIRCAFEDVHFDQLDPTFSIRQLARVKSDYLPYRSFRTYHPNYLNRAKIHDAVANIILDNSRS